ncbi:MAG: DUF2975 domain-containing protein [Lachnospiraceae bacterium]|nr:DUF2975 domain-containing protein [Lachnospiraceae bacterium]
MNTENSVNKLIYFTRLIVLFLFGFGIITILSLPFSIKWYIEHFETTSKDYYYAFVLIFAFCGVMALLILWQLKKMLDTVISNDCFVLSNVVSLNKMSVYSILITIAMVIRCIFTPTFTAACMVLTFFIASLFSKILAMVFESAVNYKIENDLTI